MNAQMNPDVLTLDVADEQGPEANSSVLEASPTNHQ